MVVWRHLQIEKPERAAEQLQESPVGVYSAGHRSLRASRWHSVRNKHTSRYVKRLQLWCRH